MEAEIKRLITSFVQKIIPRLAFLIDRESIDFPLSKSRYY